MDSWTNRRRLLLKGALFRPDAWLTALMHLGSNSSISESGNTWSGNKGVCCSPSLVGTLNTRVRKWWCSTIRFWLGRSWSISCIYGWPITGRMKILKGFRRGLSETSLHLRVFSYKVGHTVNPHYNVHRRWRVVKSVSFCWLSAIN